jgi:hypothetical protein
MVFMQQGNSHIKQGTWLGVRCLLTFLSTKLVQKTKPCPHDSIAARQRRRALILLKGKMFFRIKALRRCCLPCAQSYPHNVCKSGRWGRANKTAGAYADCRCLRWTGGEKALKRWLIGEISRECTACLVFTQGNFIHKNQVPGMDPNCLRTILSTEAVVNCSCREASNKLHCRIRFLRPFTFGSFTCSPYYKLLAGQSGCC